MKEDFPPIFGPGRHLLSIQDVRRILAPQGSDPIRYTMYLELFALYRRLQIHGIRCQLWLDGSFVTEKLQPSDVDLSIMVHEDTYQTVADEGKQLLDDLTYSCVQDLLHLDAFVCIFGTKGSDDYELDNPLDWAQQWGRDHSGRYLKGFVVVEVHP